MTLSLACCCSCVATYEPNEEECRLWSFAVRSDEQQMISAGSDGALTIWDDTTSSVRFLAAAFL